MNSNFEFWVVGVMMTLVAMLGFLGNIISILIYKYKRLGLKNTFTSLLTWLALVDSIFLVGILLGDLLGPTNLSEHNLN